MQLHGAASQAPFMKPAITPAFGRQSCAWSQFCMAVWGTCSQKIPGLALVHGPTAIHPGHTS